MKMTLSEFARLPRSVEVTIHSLTPSLYQVILLVHGKSRLLAFDDGRPYRAPNLQNVREMLASMPVRAITMRHESAYDEMIGQPDRAATNALEIGLSPLEPDHPTFH